MTNKRTLKKQLHIVSAVISVFDVAIMVGIICYYWDNPFQSGARYACPFFLFLLGIVVLNVCMILFTSPLHYGVKHLMIHYYLLCSIEKALINANYCFSREESKIVRVPKIKLEINQSLKKGKLYIENSMQNERRLEKDDISSAMGNYVVMKTYLTDNRNYYVYEFMDINTTKQKCFDSCEHFLEHTTSFTNNYSLYIDEMCQVNMQSLLLCGATGSGKTYGLYSLLLQIINKPIIYHIYSVDLKNSSLSVIANCISEESANSLETAIVVLEDFTNAMEKRKEEIKTLLSSKLDADYKEFGLDPFIFVIDEYASFISLLNQKDKKTRDHVQSMIGRIILEGRQLGFHIWITMQKSDSSIITTAFRDNLTLKIVLGNAEDTTYTTTFGQGADIPPLNYKRGQGVYTEPSFSSKPTFCSFPILGFDIFGAFKKRG